MNKINLEGIALKMSKDQMKNVLGGSGGSNCNCDKKIKEHECYPGNGKPQIYSCYVDGKYVGCTDCTGVPNACDGCR